MINQVNQDNNGNVPPPPPPLPPWFGPGQGVAPFPGPGQMPFPFPMLPPANSIPGTETETESDTFSDSTLAHVYINLDKLSREYTSGETITGKVNVHVFPGHSINASEITVRFLGKIDTMWSTKRATFRGEETLFDILTHVLGPSQNPIEIPTGRHEYQFSIQVPNMPLPLSSNIPHVQVLYQLEANIRRLQWSMNDPKSDTIPISIATILDLNQFGGTRKPVNLEKKRKLPTCFCFHRKPLTIQVLAPKTGYVPGDHVRFVVEVDNKSKKVINNLTAKLIHTCTITGYNIDTQKEGNKKIYTLLQTESRGRINAGENVKWEATLTVPPSAPPSSAAASSKYIRLDYKIKVKAALGARCYIKHGVSLLFPVYVGTIPLTPLPPLPPPAIVGTAPLPVQNEVPHYDETGGLA